MSPSLRFGFVTCHFCQLCRLQKYSFCHLDQNVSAKAWTLLQWFFSKSLSVNSSGSGGGAPIFCVRSIVGVRIRGASGSVEIDISCCVMTMAETSAIKVTNTFMWKSRISIIFKHVVQNLTCHSNHTLPRAGQMGEWGGLKTHIHPWFRRNVLTALCVRFIELNFSSLQAPIKFVPQSDLNCLEKNLWRVLMKLDELKDSTTSIWMALVDIHVNKTTHLLLLPWIPSVRLVTNSQGPNIPKPT